MDTISVFCCKATRTSTTQSALRDIALFHQRLVEVQTVFQHITSPQRSSDTSTGWMVLDDSEGRDIKVLPLKINDGNISYSPYADVCWRQTVLRKPVCNYEVILSTCIPKSPRCIWDCGSWEDQFHVLRD
jgi:hypothetical protein